MKRWAILGVAALVLGGMALSRAFGAVGGGATGAPAAAPVPGLACVRSAFTAAERTRHFDELGPALRAERRSVRELPDGYEFELPADAATLALAAEWAAGERRCCPFFDIELRLPSGGGPLWLRLTGKEGVKRFIQTEAAVWITG